MADNNLALNDVRRGDILNRTMKDPGDADLPYFTTFLNSQLLIKLIVMMSSIVFNYSAGGYEFT
jgi:hypothetical protein